MASATTIDHERTLLVVEDEDSIREPVSTALRFNGFVVTSVASGRNALAEARNEMMGKIQVADDARTAGEVRLRRFVA